MFHFSTIWLTLNINPNLNFNLGFYLKAVSFLARGDIYIDVRLEVVMIASARLFLGIPLVVHGETMPGS